MTTLTVGVGRTRSLGFVGDWPGQVTPAEYNGEIIVSATATTLTVLSAGESQYFEYFGSFKYTNPAPVGLTMSEVGLSGSVTGVDMYTYTNSLADKKLCFQN
jgi:hypothetical protein